jgi:hypothetical protein
MLYCPKTGRSHISLIDFGIYRCPVCEFDLSNPVNPYIGVRLPPQPVTLAHHDAGEEASPIKHHTDDELISLSQPVDKLGPGDDGLEMSHQMQSSSQKGNTGLEAKRIAYTIEYRDSDDKFLSKVPWPHRFDLAEARKGITSPEKPAFEVHSVLSTSIPPDKYRTFTDVEDIMTAGILENPSYTVYTRTTKITIHSPAILDTINRVVPYYPGVNLGGDELEIDEPFALIAHYKGHLEAYRLNALQLLAMTSSSSSTLGADKPEYALDGRAIEDVGLLLESFYQPMYSGRVADEEARHSQDPPLCTFRMLWLLFKPGDTVYMESDGELGAYVVHRVEIDPDILSAPIKRLNPYTVHLWSLDFDGQYVGRCLTSINITPFTAERKVSELKAFPCHFQHLADAGETRERLIQQGKKWYRLLRMGMIEYSGYTIGPIKRHVRAASRLTHALLINIPSSMAESLSTVLCISNTARMTNQT